MIDKKCIERAISIGGIESWKYLKENMTCGQKFYCIDKGEIAFAGFLVNGGEFGAAIFETKVGYSSYDYFYRELLCGESLFINHDDCDKAKIKRAVSRVVRNSDDELKSKFEILKILSSDLSVEVNPVSEKLITKLLAVSDIFIGDNGNLVISVDDI